MKSILLVRVAPLCAALLVLKGDETLGFMVIRGHAINATAPVGMGDSDRVSSLYKSDSGVSNPMKPSPLFPLGNDEQVSLVEASDDDDDDDDPPKSSESSENHGSHTSHESSEKPAGEESKKEEKSEKDDKDKNDVGKPKGKTKEEKHAEENKKAESLLTNPQEQSAFIRKAMNKAADHSYQSLKKLVKVMDKLNGVVALVNALVQLPPPGHPFAESIMIETSGNKVSLKGLLDEATAVKAKVDTLFTTLLAAKHSIIGSINIAARALAPPPKPPAA